MQHRNALKTSRQPSLIEVVSEGFTATNRRIWVLLIPIALDLILWLAPRIGIAPLLTQVRALNPSTWDQTFAAFGEGASEQFASSDLRFATFAGPLQLLVPALTTPVGQGDAWQLSTWAGLLGTLLLVNVGTLILAAVYATPLAGAVKGSAVGAVRAIGRIIAAFLGVAALVVGTLFVASLLMVLLVGVLSLVAQPLAIFAFVLWVSLALWWVFVTSFGFDAVLLDGVGPVRALWKSFVLVQRSLWGALGLWLLSALIVLGFGVIWQALAVSSAGLVVAIVGNAYITTGLAAAHLVFYRNRAALIAPQPPTAQRPL